MTSRDSTIRVLRRVAILPFAMAFLLFASPGARAATPLAAYSFDKGEGTILDDSAGNHDGTIEGATWTGEGKYGSALQFNGASSLVSVADAADLDLTSSFTLEAWVRPDESVKNWKPVISKLGASASNWPPGYILAAQGLGRPGGYTINSEGVRASAEGVSALPAGAWSHLAFTSDGTNLRLYVNGALVVTRAALPAAATEGALEIGHTKAWYGQYFAGRIDEIRIYGQPLSQTQIEADMRTPVRDVHDTRRDGSAYNANFHNSGVDDYRVDANMAEFDFGMWQEEPTLNLVHRIDCVNPDPWHELLGEYTLPTSKELEEPERWWTDQRLQEQSKSLPFPGPWGCRENFGDPKPGQFDAETHTTHGVGVSNRAAEIDGVEGLGGVAAGARITSVRVIAGEKVAVLARVRNPKSMPQSPEYEPQAPEWLPQAGVSYLVAGLDWATATREDANPANDVDVIDLPLGCLTMIPPGFEGALAEVPPCNGQPLEEAVSRAIDHGIVVVAGAAGGSIDVASGMPQADPAVLTVSNVLDADGQPGGRTAGQAGTVCVTYDDHLRPESNFGLAVDLAVPGCEESSGATGKAGGAAAALASQCPAHNRAGVEYIVDTLMAQGDTGEISEGGWEDTSGDGWKEPLLDLRNEEVFNPVMEKVVGGKPTGELDHQPNTGGCPWLSHQAESDVNSDGRADLVTVASATGSAEVFAGAYEEADAGPPSLNGYRASAPTVSLQGRLNPAQRDGTGAYTIDSADVTGDRHADLITTAAQGGVLVYPGNGEGRFAEAVASQQKTLFGLAGAAAEDEPIAVADVNGDGRADLIAHRNADNHILTFLGQANGSFAEPVDSGFALNSALIDRGNYFLDVIDVTGEELNEPNAQPIDYFARHSYADLVVSNTNGTVSVYPGQANGKFGLPVTAAQLNPIYDDAQGEEVVGLGDVNRDRRADLLTLSGETLKLRRATKNGTFEAPTVAYQGKVDSSLFDGKGQQLIGLQDYSRDGLADLVAVSEKGELLTYTARRDFTFAPPVLQGTVSSLRSDPNGHEFATEKPLLARQGCRADGCSLRHVPRFEAESYPLTLSGTGFPTFALSGTESVTCSTSSLSGQLEAATALVPLSAEYGGCLATGEHLTKVYMHSCRYELHVQNAGPPYTGTLGVGCSQPEDAIEYKTYLSKTIEDTLICTTKVSAQEAKPGVSLANTGSGSERAISLNAKVEGLQYQRSGTCGTKTSTGTLSGQPTLIGKNAEGKRLGAYIGGQKLALGAFLAGQESTEKAKQPRFEAESYPLTLSGTGFPTFALSGTESVTCSTSSLSGQLEAATALVPLSAEYGGCLATGEHLTKVYMHSCRYELHVQNAGPPYTGTLGVGCSQPEDAIEYKTYLSKTIEDTLICTTKVSAQEAKPGVSLANTGSGSERAISLNAKVEGLQYQRSGTCGTKTSTGTLSGQPLLSGVG
jgi:Concanavalin A-like lectin/glucanases superfamily/FG-GAP-like repeat